MRVRLSRWGLVKLQQKEYYEKNKDSLKEKKLEYIKQNNNIIKERRKEKIVCECGLLIIKDSKARHQRTKKHIDKMLEING